MRPEAGQTERELAGAVRDWSAGLAPRIADAERDGALPADVIHDLGELGVLGMGVPEADGGLGASTVVFALVLEELGAAWPSLAIGVSVNSGIVAGSIVRNGTREQRARWLPRVMDGSGLGAFALTEAGSGSDAASLRATARRDSDGWVLNGRKHFVTNAHYAPLVITFSNRCFPTKAIACWRLFDDDGHLRLIGHYLNEAGNWCDVASCNPCPPRQGPEGDPLYAVIARCARTMPQES